jgi:hypothetical protein
MVVKLCEDETGGRSSNGGVGFYASLKENLRLVRVSSVTLRTTRLALVRCGVTWEMY